jgi:integrase
MASLFTSATYERSIATVRRGLNAPEGLDFLNDSGAVIGWIDQSKYATNSRKTFYIAIVSTLKKNNLFPVAYQAYKDKMDTLNHLVVTKVKAQELTEAEKSKYMEWPEVLECLEKIRLAAHDPQTFQEYLIICLYTMMRPIRLDYAEMKIVSEEPAEHGSNYLVWPLVGKPYIFLTDYKTYKKWGAQRTTLPPALCDVIQEWRSMVDDEYLLIGANGLPMKEWELGQTVIKVFEKHSGKSVGVNILRHSHSSWERRFELSFKDSEELARQMGHSQAMSALYRRI